MLRCRQKADYVEGIDEPCITVGYGIIGDSLDMYDSKYQRYHELMNSVSDNNQFEFGKDVKPLVVGGHMKLENYLEQNKNTTKYVVMFCHDHWDEQLEMVSLERPKNITYQESLKLTDES